MLTEGFRDIAEPAPGDCASKVGLGWAGSGSVTYTYDASVTPGTSSGARSTATADAHITVEIKDADPAYGPSVVFEGDQRVRISVVRRGGGYLIDDIEETAFSGGKTRDYVTDVEDNLVYVGHGLER